MVLFAREEKILPRCATAIVMSQIVFLITVYPCDKNEVGPDGKVDQPWHICSGHTTPSAVRMSVRMTCIRRYTYKYVSAGKHTQSQSANTLSVFIRDCKSNCWTDCWGRPGFLDNHTHTHHGEHCVAFLPLLRTSDMKMSITG